MNDLYSRSTWNGIFASLSCPLIVRSIFSDKMGG